MHGEFFDIRKIKQNFYAVMHSEWIVLYLRQSCTATLYVKILKCQAI